MNNVEKLAEVMRQTGVRRERLTKSLFMSLPSGAYVVSNLYPNARESAFAEKVGSDLERVFAWKRVKIAKANGKLCRITCREDQFNQLQAPGDLR
jgi:hypothetical protein